MVRTSQCFRTEFFQLDGLPTLAAAEAVLCTLIRPASLIKLDCGAYPSIFLAGTNGIFSCRVFSSRTRTSANSLPSPYGTAVFEGNAPRLRPLRGFGKLLFEATRESKFRPNTKGESRRHRP